MTQWCLCNDRPVVNNDMDDYVYEMLDRVLDGWVVLQKGVVVHISSYLFRKRISLSPKDGY